MGDNINYTPINTINSDGQRVNIKGRVTYTSSAIHFTNFNKEGYRLCLDVSDETGEIRVFAWDGAAQSIGQITKDKCVQLINVAVQNRTPQYNNLMRHPFELKIDDHSVINFTVGEHPEIPAKEEEIVFVPYEEVRKKEHPEFTYFSVHGKVKEVTDPWPWQGERGNPFSKQIITIEDEEGNEVKIASWNSYVPVSDIMGKTLTVVRAKYIRRYDELNSSYARISIDDVRVR